VLLKQAPSLAFDLPGVLLRRLIDRSLLYLVDGGGLEAILQFTAETWTGERTIAALFKKTQLTLDSCSAYDLQNVSQMGEFIATTDPKVDYQCKLVLDDEPQLRA